MSGFCVINLGCKVNRVESDAVCAYLLKNGWHAVSEKWAQYIVINTCTVTSVADKKTRKTIHRALSANPFARVIVTGCASEINPNEYKSMSCRIEVVPKADLSKYCAYLVSMERKRLELKGSKTCCSSKSAHDESMFQEDTDNKCAQINSQEDTDNKSAQINSQKDTDNKSAYDENICHGNIFTYRNQSASTLKPSYSLGSMFRTRAGVKVQDGCNNACTYCIVHVARGKSHSESPKKILNECLSLQQDGVREIVLSGINLGSYSYVESVNKDIYKSANQGIYKIENQDNNKSENQDMLDKCSNYNLSKLLLLLLDSTNALDSHALQPSIRFRVGSIEPNNLDDEFIDLMSKSRGAIARHLHLPLQSASTEVLKRMGRPYTFEHYYELVSKLRRKMPSISLSTDIIVGFPGETEEQFLKTCKRVQQLRFMKIHVFPYSKRPGTPAEKMSGHIPEHVKEQRSKYVRNLSNKLAKLDFSTRLGSCELALVEQCGIATLESYHQVRISSDFSSGSLVPYSILKEESRYVNGES